MKVAVFYIDQGSHDPGLTAAVKQVLNTAEDAELCLADVRGMLESGDRFAVKEGAALFVFGAAVDIKTNMDLVRTLAESASRRYFLFLRHIQKSEDLGLSVELSYAIGEHWQFTCQGDRYEEAVVQVKNALYFLNRSEQVTTSLSKARAQLEDWKPLSISEQQRWVNADYYLDAIVRSSREAYIGKDPGNVIRFWNKGAEVLYGYSYAEAVGKHVSIIVPSDRLDELSEMIGRVTKNHETVHRETVRRHKDGTLVDISLSLSPILDQNGILIGIAAVSRDIRERKKAEQEVEQRKNDLEAVNRELRDFAHVISHDLKAPLRAVSHLAAWIYEDYIDKLDEAGKQNLLRLKGSVTRMSDLIDGVLNYSSIGRRMEKREFVDLNALLRETISILHVPEHIEINVENKLPAVFGCRVQLGQVFQNLLNNAIQNMDKEHGEILVRCALVNDQWRVAIQDNGRGIEQKQFDKIFQPFQTLSQRDGVKSTGIGLSIVRKVIEIHGGKIWLESEPGKGTVFYFTLSADSKNGSQ